MVTTNTNDIEPRGLGVEDACTYAGNFSKATLYRLMADGTLRYYMIGNRRFVLKAELDRYIDSQVV